VKDRFWHEVDLNVRPLLRSDDVVLAPHGDWPIFPCAARFYEDWMEIGDTTILILHKGHVTGMPKRDLARIAESWQCIYANGVMVVFSRTPRLARDYRRGSGKWYFKTVDRYLRSAELRKRKTKICYVHVPKAAGTSMWNALRKQFPSHVYYSSTSACLRNPPQAEDYDLIGVHFSPSVVASSLSAEDRIVGLVREPMARFFSSVLHARRANEDPESFTGSQRMMRELPLNKFLDAEDGHYESRLQLILFGTHYSKAFHEHPEEEMLAAATAFACREDVILGPSEQSQRFAQTLSHELSLKPLALHRLNVNDRAQVSASLEEFARLEALVTLRVSREREWYEFVCRQFDERFPDVPRRRRRLFGLFGHGQY
jgi:hypothetical protein